MKASVRIALLMLALAALSGCAHLANRDTLPFKGLETPIFILTVLRSTAVTGRTFPVACRRGGSKHYRLTRRLKPKQKAGRLIFDGKKLRKWRMRWLN